MRVVCRARPRILDDRKVVLRVSQAAGDEAENPIFQRLVVQAVFVVDRHDPAYRREMGYEEIDALFDEFEFLWQSFGPGQDARPAGYHQRNKVTFLDAPIPFR